MSKFLSLEWFKGKIEHSIDQVISNKLESLMEEDSKLNSSEPTEKPYVNVKLVNNIMTIVMSDYSIMTKMNATEEDFHAVESAKDLAEIIMIVSDPNVVNDKVERETEVKKIRALQKGSAQLELSGEFTVKDGSVYLKGMSRSLPRILVEEFIQVAWECTENNESLSTNDKFLSLKRFFMWCCLNPRAEVAHELYRFLKENSFRITNKDSL